MYRHFAMGSDSSLQRIWHIMISYPYLVAGKGRFDTALMEVTHGEIVVRLVLKVFEDVL